MFTEGSILEKRKDNVCNVFTCKNDANVSTFVFKLDMDRKVMCGFKLKMSRDNCMPIYFIIKTPTRMQTSQLIRNTYMLNNDLYMECQIYKTYKHHDIIYDFVLNKDWKPYYTLSNFGILLNILIVEVV